MMCSAPSLPHAHSYFTLRRVCNASGACDYVRDVKLYLSPLDETSSAPGRMRLDSPSFNMCLRSEPFAISGDHVSTDTTSYLIEVNNVVVLRIENDPTVDEVDACILTGPEEEHPNALAVVKVEKATPDMLTCIDSKFFVLVIGVSRYLYPLLAARDTERLSSPVGNAEAIEAVAWTLSRFLIEFIAMNTVMLNRFIDTLSAALEDRANTISEIYASFVKIEGRSTLPHLVSRFSLFKRDIRRGGSITPCACVIRDDTVASSSNDIDTTITLSNSESVNDEEEWFWRVETFEVHFNARDLLHTRSISFDNKNGGRLLITDNEGVTRPTRALESFPLRPELSSDHVMSFARAKFASNTFQKTSNPCIFILPCTTANGRVMLRSRVRFDTCLTEAVSGSTTCARQTFKRIRKIIADNSSSASKRDDARRTLKIMSSLAPVLDVGFPKSP